MTDVLVQVVGVQTAGTGREISWGGNLAEALAQRVDDIKTAIGAGARTIADSLEQLPGPIGWQLSEVTGSFGLSLTAEAGVILTKASAETTFEVTITFTRNDK